MTIRNLIGTILVLALGAGVVGCETHTGNAALLGGAGGAALGAAVGSHSHSRAGAGALVGGAIGAIGGAIVGNEMDRQDRESYYGYSRGGGRYYEDDGYDDRAYRPRHRRTVRYSRTYECEPRYEYRSVRRYGGRGGRYYESTYYEY
jgi:uncharacterized protein YcfJ